MEVAVGPITLTILEYISIVVVRVLFCSPSKRQLGALWPTNFETNRIIPFAQEHHYYFKGQIYVWRKHIIMFCAFVMTCAGTKLLVISSPATIVMICHNCVIRILSKKSRCRTDNTFQHAMVINK
jgi:hypothetical protein